MYSIDLHKALLDYPIIADKLDKPNIEKLDVYGFNARDLSGISIHKTGEPFEGEDVAALITIREIEPCESNSDFLVRDLPISTSDLKIIKTTDYIRYSDGTFSDPEQTTTIFSPDRYNNLTVLNALGQVALYFMKQYIRLENSTADDLELSNIEERLAQTYREFDKIFSEERIFSDAIGGYDENEHKRLCHKLGALILF